MHYLGVVVESPSLAVLKRRLHETLLKAEGVAVSCLAHSHCLLEVSVLGHPWRQDALQVLGWFSAAAPGFLHCVNNMCRSRSAPI